ncbi:hypothetical protein ACUN24_20145 [Pedobacter sp. WC2501]|uniref:hypothetical protein n=1 Tax=Pedobacter sp. WC2501 TaxID=3461400 RepID=UPI004045E210
MKSKIILMILTGIFFIQSESYSQESTLNRNTTFSVPEGFVKQTESNRLAMTKSNQMKAAALPKGLNRLMYSYQDVFVTLSSTDKPQKADLETLKKGMDELSKGIPSYSSKIINVNGNKVLLIDNTVGERITFYATNSTGSSLVNGMLEFNRADHQKALGSVQAILKNINFKN